MELRTYLIGLTIIGAFALGPSALGETDPVLPTAISPALTVPILSPYKLSADQTALLETGVPILDVWEGREDRRIVEVFGAIHIDAAPAKIWEIMKDCQKQFQIIANMTKCEVEAEDIQAGWDERVQVVSVSAFLPRVKSKFRSEYSPYREIRISRTGGDLAILDGLWNLTSLASGKTRVTYRARLKPKLPVPRKIMQKGTAKDMPEVLKNLRDLAESPPQIDASEPTDAPQAKP